MRIERLDLKAFGPFTEHPLDLSGEAGFHVVYGSNGAGKTSALRAVGDLLFGIPERTPDAFVHSMQDLRIGALLVGAGTRLDIVRRKGRVNTLLDASGAVVDEAALTRLLGAVDRSLFETMYGLSHERLRSGGEDLLAARGRLGEALFGAGLGVTGLQAVLRDLDQEADALFRPQASNPTINAAFRKLGDERSRVQAFTLRPEDWRKRVDDLAFSREERAEVEEHLAIGRTELARLKRLRDVLPLVAQRQQALDERAALGGPPLVSPEDADARVEIVGALALAREARVGADERIAALDRQLAELELSEGLVARAEEVTALFAEVGAYTKASVDLPRIEGALRAQQELVSRLGEALSPGIAVEEIEKRRPVPAAVSRVRTLAGRHSALLVAVDAAESALREKKAQLELERERLTNEPIRHDAGDLAEAVDAAQRAGRPEATLADAQRVLSELDDKVARAVGALPLWEGSAEGLLSLPVPVDETVARFEREAAKLTDAATEIDVEKRGTDERLASAQQQLAQLEEDGVPPDEDVLHASRSRRDEGWALVRAVWLEGADVAEATPHFDPELPLDQAYERAVEYADSVADGRYANASRLAERAQVEGRVTTARTELETIDIRRSGLAAASAEFAENWREVWTSCGIVPLPPLEMRGWLGRREAIVALVSERLTQCSRVEAAEAEVEQLRGKLGTALQAAGLPKLAEDETLEASLSRASTELRTSQKSSSRREALEDLIRRGESDVATLETKAADVRGALARWQRDWADALTSLDLQETSTPEEVLERLTTLDELFGAVDQGTVLRERINGMHRDRETFAEKAEALIVDLAPDLASRDPAAAIGELNARCTRAAVADERATQLKRQLDETRDNHARTQTTEGELERRLDGLLGRAECADAAELEEESRRSAQARELDARIDALDIQIALAGADTVERLVGEAALVSRDELEAILPDIARTVEEREAQWQEVSERIGTQKTAVDEMDGGDEALAAAEEAQSVIAEIGRESYRYARLRLASTLLRRAVERYREESQGPILRRVEQLLPQLTLGTFDGVAVDYDDHDRPILVGRRGAEKVPVLRMSDGERDQLYLALRIAGLERYAEVGEQPPFVADDLFVNFDDDRARAGFGVLAGLTERVQVLFFTHHRQLVDIARDAIPQDVLHVHELPSPVLLPSA